MRRIYIERWPGEILFVRICQDGTILKRRDFPLFRDCFSQMTRWWPVLWPEAQSWMADRGWLRAAKKYGRIVSKRGLRYQSLARWLMTDNREPYNSFRNGSAMRVSPCAWVMEATTGGYRPKENVWRNFLQGDAPITIEGIKRWQPADAIYMCRYFFGSNNTEIKTSEEL